MSPPIIVVSGLPRSGTSLMMQMLEAAGVSMLVDGARSADADNPRGYYELEAVKSIARDAAFLAVAPGRAVKIVAPLLRHLPEAYAYRVILMERAVEEVVGSQERMLGRRGASGRKADPAAMGRALSGALEDARRSLVARDRVELLRVAHHRLVATPSDEARRVAAFLAIEEPLRIAAMGRVVDHALHRQRSQRSA